jgi:hypothetical protein
MKRKSQKKQQGGEGILDDLMTKLDNLTTPKDTTTTTQDSSSTQSGGSKKQSQKKKLDLKNAVQLLRKYYSEKFRK